MTESIITPRVRCRTCDVPVNEGERFCVHHKPKRRCKAWLCEFPAKNFGFCEKHYEQIQREGHE